MPLDLEQTHQSLAKYAIEEAHELAEAIESEDIEDIRDELGDVLLQVILHSVIATQKGTFELEDVIESIAEKMVRRHPHVFSDTSISGKNEVIDNWQAIKEREKKPAKNSFDVPKGLPALQRSSKIGAKTRKFNFDWKTPMMSSKKFERN